MRILMLCGLVAVTIKAEAMERHIEDSLRLLPIIDAYSCQPEQRVIDIGSGAGIPGIIFAIARPSWQVTSLTTYRQYGSSKLPAFQHTTML